MSKCVPANPVCSRSGTDRIARPSGVAQTTVAVDPVCRYAAGTQTTVPDPSN